MRWRFALVEPVCSVFFVLVRGERDGPKSVMEQVPSAYGIWRFSRHRAGRGYIAKKAEVWGYPISLDRVPDGPGHHQNTCVYSTAGAVVFPRPSPVRLISFGGIILFICLWASLRRANPWTSISQYWQAMILSENWGCGFEQKHTLVGLSPVSSTIGMIRTEQVHPEP
ncbi:hypothetical protein QBC35DRAFT_489782 [Podospora australis]|uniref:Uncharacterized protein n=1 Tax=Podospora australis TaxID=1536484 RepID=A0AAN6WYG8_9PEZI|nr:hypothetical protein QBC35DRAFT_489782 [Podospora australis]